MTGRVSDQLSREPRSVSVAAEDPTRLGAPFVRGRGVGLGPLLRRMSTATVSASRPPLRAGGVGLGLFVSPPFASPPFASPFVAAGTPAAVPFGFTDTGGVGAVWIRSKPRDAGAIKLVISHPTLGSRSVSVRSRLPINQTTALDAHHRS